MTLDDFCTQMGFDNTAKRILEDAWSDARQTDCMPDFMRMDFCRNYYPLTGGDPEVLERMETVSRITEHNPAAIRYAYLLHDSIFLRKSPLSFGTMPLPEKIFGENAGVFCLMVAVSALPLIEKTMELLNIPLSYAHDIAKWLGGTIQIFKSGHNGLPGFNLQQASWIRDYIDGKLFRIGRFEYLMHPCPEWVPAIYRNRKDGSLMVLCRDKWRFTADGRRPRTTTPESEIVTTKLKILDGRVTGTPISPRGEVLLGRKVTIGLDEWDGICLPWELVPSIHIPGGGGMTPEAAGNSMREAKEFFRKYFKQDIKIFVCASWILNPDWEEELPDSNLTKFMRELYLTPGWDISGLDGLFFIFGRSDGDPLTYPADNSVRKAFHRLFAAGKPPRSGAMFFLTEHLDQFGTQYYRNH
jgi:hypothetical protein